MEKFYLRFAKCALAFIIVSAAIVPASAQMLRGAYFLDNATISNRMNPAMRPDRGFVEIPAIGGTYASFNTSGFAVKDLVFVNNGKLVTFIDDAMDWNYNNFLNNIATDNKLDVNAGVSLLGVGWYSGKGFWTAEVKLNNNINTNLPKTMFEFIRKNHDRLEYKIYDFNLGVSSYLEFAAGYSRPITDRLTVGGKLKILAGIADFDMKVDEISAVFDGGWNMWQMNSYASVDATMKGIKAKHRSGQDGQYVSGFDTGSFGLAGMGAGVDLGVTYQLMENLRVSAAVLDLGFISWSKNSTISAKKEWTKSYYFKGFESDSGSASGQLDDIADDLGGMFQMGETAPKSRTKSLSTTINVGGEYSFLNNLLSAGVLSSTRFGRQKTYTELTAMCNVRPAKWFSGSLSYSFVNGEFETFGLALNFSPSWINFFLGSDYVFFNTQKGVPQVKDGSNFYMGLSVPIGRRR